MIGGAFNGGGEALDPIIGGEVKQPPEDPTDPVKPMPELISEPVGEVTHEYLSGTVMADILPDSAWVLDFPGPFKEYAPPASSPEDFVGRVCMLAIGIAYDNWADAGGVAPVSKAVVTITDGPRSGEQVVTDEGGYFLFRAVAGDSLCLRVEREYLEPKEVIAYRSRSTELREIGPNRVRVRQEREGLDAPGIVLMGLRWPDAVRLILECEVLPHDLLYMEALPEPRLVGLLGGGYGNEDVTVRIFNFLEDRGRLYSVLAHELGHARQHAVAIVNGGTGTWDWENTPEGKAYKAAWEKDLAEIPRERWLGTLDKSDYYESNLLENAAEFCAMYWNLEIGMLREESLLGGLQARAPHRFKWCQTYLNNKLD